MNDMEIEEEKHRHAFRESVAESLGCMVYLLATLILVLAIITCEHAEKLDQIHDDLVNIEGVILKK